MGTLVLAACGGGGGGGDGGPLPDGIVDPGTTYAHVESFVHVADGTNILGSLTRLDNALADGNPDARIFVTPIWVAADMVYVNTNVLVRYLGTSWFIQCADGSDDMPFGATFAVTVATEGYAGETHFGLVDAVPDPVLESRALLDHPATNDNPSAVLLLTVNASPGGTAGPEFDVPSTYPDLPFGADAIVHVMPVVHGGLMSSTPYGVTHHTRGWGVMPQNGSSISSGQIYNMVVALP